MRRSSLFTLLIVISLSAACAEDLQLSALKAQVDVLAKLVEQQRTEIDALRKSPPATKEVLDDLIEKYGSLEDQVEERTAQAIKIASRNKPTSGNLSVGAAVDTSFGYNSGPARDTVRPAVTDFELRGAELVFTADVDPFFKSYMVVNAAGDAANNDEAQLSIEEAAIYTTSLTGVQVKGGRFFAPFGRLSSIHDHDLPFTTRPRSLDNYVGGESGGDGIQVQALVPIKQFLQITGGVFNKLGAEFPLRDAAGQHRDVSELTLFGKVLTSFDLCTNHTFEIGLSAIEVPNATERRDLTNLEFTYKWHPKNGNALREKLVVGAEFMRNDLRTPFTVSEALPPPPHPFFTGSRRTGYGGYGYGEYFMTRHWSAGGRIDMFDNVDPLQQSKRVDQTYTLFATYRFSEFSRLRVEASRHEYFNGDRGNELLIQWSAFWGAHVHDFNGR